jgi:uncharacterized membrane protein (GlpM family)
MVSIGKIKKNELSIQNQIDYLRNEKVPYYPMTHQILLQVLLSFVLAGSVIALLTLLAERFGSRVGGLITNLPSNILITLIFITLTRGMDFMQGMIPAVPIGMLIDVVFLVVFILLLRYNLWISIIGSVISWLLLAYMANLMEANNLWINTLVYMGGSLLAFLLIELGWKIPAVGRSNKRYTLLQMTLRAVFAGTIVGGVVLIAHFVPPYLTGIVSTFPAVLFSSMVILAVARGKAFARATGKIMIIASTNIVIYALGVYYTYPTIGIIWGTIISFALAFLWIVGMKKMMEIWYRK